MFASVNLPRPRKREKIPSSFAVSDSNTRYPYLVLDAHEVDKKLLLQYQDIMGVFLAVCQARALPLQQFSFWLSRRIECGPQLEGELRFELTPLDHEVHQVMPAFKHHITGQGSYILEKRLASCQYLTQYGIALIAPFQHCMGQESQQIEAEHRRREILLAMAEVMLEMVAFGLEDIVVFVFNLPPSTTGVGHLCHVLCAEPVIGDKGVVVELCTRCGIDYGHLDPIDRERMLTALQQDLIDEAINGYFRHPPLPATLFTLGDC